MNQDLNDLEDLFIRLQGSKISGFSYSNNILRLQIQSTIAPFLLPGSRHLHLVLSGCTHLFYLSYRQTQENRIPIENPEVIFSRELILQGIELSNRESVLSNTKEGFILYCSSDFSLVEAGELHFKARGFQVYDQEFGRVSYPEFCRASEVLKSSIK
jgi:hypothetical protein